MTVPDGDWSKNLRLHTEIGMVPPADFEANYYRQSNPAEMAGSQTRNRPEFP